MLENIFDTHAHYDDERFDQDRDTLLYNINKNCGVCGIINVGASLKGSIKSVELASKYPFIYAAVGIHPEYASLDPENFLEIIEDLASNKKVVAVGEIGLDYHYTGYNKDKQIDLFVKQLTLTKKLNLPVSIHSRDAHQDTLEILKKFKPKGVMHCFGGSPQYALEVLKLGLYLGIGGVATFKNAKNIIDVIKEVPLEKLLLETDAPYLAPEPYRGKRCDSSMMEFVANKIAEVKNTSASQVTLVTKQNACNLFNIKF